MTMTPGLRKLALTAHVACAVGWIGAVAAFLALALAGLASADVQGARAMYLAMDLTGWYVIVPLCLASLATGLIQALGTPWGLVRKEGKESARAPRWAKVLIASIVLFLIAMRLFTHGSGHSPGAG